MSEGGSKTQVGRPGAEATVAGGPSQATASDTDPKVPSGVEATLAGASPAPPTPDELVEVTRDHYEITGELARGGMGRILIARDRRIGRTVALKELIGTNDSLFKRFEREALVTGRLQHPAIVPVYEAGRWPSGEPFFAMKLVKGKALDKVIAGTSTLQDRLAQLPTIIHVAEAMAYAHGEGVIHRDLKPGNVLVGDYGETVVVDWGLAKDLRDTAAESLPAGPIRTAATSGDLTAIGSVMGTPMYMPVEQARGESLDARADVYALGAILYHVLAGVPPYTGRTADEVLDRVNEGPPRPLATVATGVPDELAAIVDKAMARRAADRYPTAKELADELVRFQAGQLVAAHRYSRWDLIKRFVRRHRAALSAAMALVVIGGVIAVISVRQVIDARDRAREALAIVEQEKRAFLVEQGRQELVAGRPTRAATLLAEAYGSGEPDDQLRMLLAQAMLPLDAQLATVDKPVATAFPLSDGRFLTVGVRGLELWTVEGALLGTVPLASSEIALARERPIVAVQQDEGVVLVDLRDLSTIATLADSADELRALAIDGSGSRIYACTTTATGIELRAWDAKGALVKRAPLAGLESLSDVSSIAALDDGRVFVAFETGTTNGAFVFDAELVPRPAIRSVVNVQVSDDGKRAVFGMEKNARGRALFGIAVIAVGATEPTILSTVGSDIAIDRAASRFLVLPGHRGNGVVLYDDTGTAIAEMPATVATISADGRHIATADIDNTIRVWDHRGQLVAVLPGHLREVTALAFAVDGNTLVSGGEDGVRTWRISNRRTYPLQARKVGDSSGSPDGRHLIAIDGTNAKVFDVATATASLTLSAGSPLWWAAYSPDGTRIVTTTSDGSLAIWDTSGRRIASAEVYAWTARFSPDGGRIVTAGDVDAHVFDAATGKKLVALPGGELVLSARFSPDGTRVVTGAADGTAGIYDVASGALRTTLRGHTDYVLDAAFDATGERVVTASGDRSARLWNAGTGAAAGVLPHPSPLLSAAFSPTADRILTIATDGGRMWDARGALAMALGGSAVLGGRFLDGGRVITYTAQRATIWDATRGVELVTLPQTPPTLREASSLLTSADQPTIRDPRQRTVELVELADREHIAFAHGGVLSIHALPREHRSADQIAKLVAERSGWKIIDGGLVPTRELVDTAHVERTRSLDSEDDAMFGGVMLPDHQPVIAIPAGLEPVQLPELVAAADRPGAGETALLHAAIAMEAWGRNDAESRRLHRKLAAAFPTPGRRIHAAYLSGGDLAYMRGVRDAFPGIPSLAADDLYQLAWIRHRLGEHVDAFAVMGAAAAADWPANRHRTIRRELERFAAFAGASLADAEASIVASRVATGVTRAQLLGELADVYRDHGEVVLEDQALRALVGIGPPRVTAYARARLARHAFYAGLTRELGVQALGALDLAKQTDDAAVRDDIVRDLLDLAAIATQYFQHTKDEGYARAALRIAAGVHARWPDVERVKIDALIASNRAEIARGPDPKVVGSYTPDILRKAFRMHMGSLRRCYERALVLAPTLQGRVTLQIAIVNGRITSVEPGASTLGDPAIPTCMAGVLRGVVLPRALYSGEIRINYPFTLRPDD